MSQRPCLEAYSRPNNQHSSVFGTQSLCVLVMESSSNYLQAANSEFLPNGECASKRIRKGVAKIDE